MKSSMSELNYFLSYFKVWALTFLKSSMSVEYFSNYVVFWFQAGFGVLRPWHALPYSHSWQTLQFDSCSCVGNQSFSVWFLCSWILWQVSKAMQVTRCENRKPNTVRFLDQSGHSDWALRCDHKVGRMRRLWMCGDAECVEMGSV